MPLLATALELAHGLVVTGVPVLEPPVLVPPDVVPPLVLPPDVVPPELVPPLEVLLELDELLSEPPPQAVIASATAIALAARVSLGGENRADLGADANTGFDAETGPYPSPLRQALPQRSAL